MNRVVPGVGVKFLLHNNIAYEIVQELPNNKFIVRNLSYGGEQTMPLEKILEHYDEGNLRFHAMGKNTVEINEGIYGDKFPDLSQLDTDERKRIVEKYDAIYPLLQLDRVGKKDIEQRAKELQKDGKKGSVASIYRWIKDYQESGGNFFSLSSNYDNCGKNHKDFFPEVVEATITNVIQKYYMRREKETVTGLQRHIRGLIDVKNKARKKEGLELYPIPSEATVRRRIHKLDLIEAAKARYGHRHAHSKYGRTVLKKDPEFPLERVEFDHTRLDLFVVDEERRLPLGRPYLSYLIDCATRYPLGFYIGFENPSFTSVMYALKHAISPKNYVKGLFPNVENNWLAYGLPEVLVVDNGKEFHSKSLDDVCLHLGIELFHTKARRPWEKGIIERSFRTINSKLLHKSPGTSFSNVIERDDYDPKKNAVISFDEFIAIFHKWLLDEYCRELHKGVGAVPQKLWESKTSGIVRPCLSAFKPDWEIILGLLGQGTIQRYGIRYSHLDYDSSELHGLKLAVIKEYGNNKTVKFKINPDDISSIHVYDPINKKYILVPCTDQEYTKGLRLYTHRMIIKHLNKEQREVDMSALARTRLELQEMIEAARASTKTRKTEMAARADGIGTQDLVTGKKKNKTNHKALKEQTNAVPSNKKEKPRKIIPIKNPYLVDDDEFDSYVAE
ncbi:Mu transposase C-terminal domain-containing protein [Bacillus sp. EB01]|uniref:Mu transposase C-terminal domain-containing protein n=1 Tax=Bacillus sp. EB01 TaxID=1347086 RepID=UPI000694A0C5|nr:DDE-type integrase/transposase/recombinase [Bacillus sp. EB01]